MRKFNDDPSRFIHVVNLAICDQKQHVVSFGIRVDEFFKLCQHRAKVGGATKSYLLECLVVNINHSLQTMNFWLIKITIQREAVTGEVMGVLRDERWVGTEAVNWNFPVVIMRL